MPVENATYINQLDTTLPSATDPESEGDDHIRLTKRVLKVTFPNLSEPVTATAAMLNSPFPAGGIILWSGAANTIPAGWHLCDGSTVARSDGNGNITCPDLRDRFVVGAGAGYAVGSTGGSGSAITTTSAAGSHSHSASTDAQGQHSHSGVTGGRSLSVEQLAPHSHPTVVASAYSGGSGAGLATSNFRLDLANATTGQTGSGAPHDHPIVADGNHAHGVYVAAVGDHAHVVTIADMRPPYFALCYVIKL